MLKETQIKFFFNIKRNYEHIEKTEQQKFNKKHN